MRKLSSAYSKKKVIGGPIESYLLLFQVSIVRMYKAQAGFPFDLTYERGETSQYRWNWRVLSARFVYANKLYAGGVIIRFYIPIHFFLPRRTD